MNIMNATFKDKFFTYFLIFLSGSACLISLFFYPIGNVDLAEKDKNFSVQDISYKAKKGLDNVIGDKILSQEKNKQEHSSISLHKKLKKINKQLSLDSQPLSGIIDQLNYDHKEVVSEMIERGLFVGVVEKLSPKLKLVLSKNLLIDPSALTVEDLNTTSLSAEDWRYLKLLANSNDLKVLLYNNELNFEFVQITNLKRLYGP